MRFLSHAETMRVFQRAIVRAGVPIAYSQGFNPHQRMSLVLPRSVGVQSDDELLCLTLKEGFSQIDAEALKACLPQGFEIISIETSQTKDIPEPVSANYSIKVNESKIDENIQKLVTKILACEKIVLNRKAGEDFKTKPVDVRPFLETIKIQGGEFSVDCKITPQGTIRVDEIMDLLKIRIEDLAGPVIRTRVQWKGI